MLLGDIIFEYRTKHQLSLRAFANKCNLSYTYISMLEKNGVKYPYNEREVITRLIDEMISSGERQAIN